MNMKRGLVFTLCALALAASANDARAQLSLGATDIALSLNLRYNDPADQTEGGTWYLVAKTGSTDGIAGVSAWIQNINGAGTAFLGNNGVVGNGYTVAVTSNTIGSIEQGAAGSNSAYATSASGFVNVVYGQNTAVVENGSIKLDVGGGAGTPGNIALDPLTNSTWNNSALLASGTFAGTRPVFGTAGTTVTAGNVLPAGATATPPANTSLTATNMSGANLRVRGDSVGLDGLELGDANRDFAVTFADFVTLQNNFGQAGVKTWDQGDFNDDGTVTFADFVALQNNFGPPNPPAPAVASVPEPTSIAIAGLSAVCGLAVARRRRK
jgi:hypothetical protein